MHGGRRLSWILLLLAACGREPEAPPARPPAPPPPEIPPPGKIQIWDWKEIDPAEYLKLESVEEPPNLLWDFSEGKQYSYDFSQMLNQVVVQTAGQQRLERKTNDRNTGKFVFTAGTGNRATVAIAIRTAESSVNGVPIAEEALKKNKPIQFQCSLREDGVAHATGKADARFFFDALLALGAGKRQVKDGSITTRTAGRFKVGPYECVRLETDFEYKPETVSGRSLIRGRTVSYFALSERKFVRASTAMSARLAVRVLGKDGVWTVSLLSTETAQRLKLRERD